jgi:hypothetical protein
MQRGVIETSVKCAAEKLRRTFLLVPTFLKDYFVTMRKNFLGHGHFSQCRS